MSASAGKLVLITQLATHCAAAATARAVARMRLLNISPSSTQTTGPQLMPKATTYRLAATRATLPTAGLSVVIASPVGPTVSVAVEKHQAIVLSVSTMPAAPTSSSGLR